MFGLVLMLTLSMHLPVVASDFWAQMTGVGMPAPNATCNSFYCGLNKEYLEVLGDVKMAST